MNLQQLAEALVITELRYAHFNACRTASQDDVETELQLNLDRCFIADRTRPTDAYYNRAVLRSSLTFPVAEATKYCSDNAIEVWPSALKLNLTSELQARGLSAVYAPCYLNATPNTVTVWPPNVTRLERAAADEFLDLLGYEGATFSAEARALKRKFYCTEGFQVFVAHDATGVACAWAAMFVAGRFAYFGNDFTRPEYRGQGHHAALIAARLKKAADLNLKAVFSDVEFSSQSHQNYERAGFRILTITTVWAVQVGSK